MAKQTLVTMVDDLDGSTENVASLEFGIDGKAYELDLSEQNAAKLREALAPFIAAARRTGGARASAPRTSTLRSSGGSGRSREETQQMREWLKDNGYPVKDRGRLPVEWVAAFEDKRPAVTTSEKAESQPETAQDAPKAKRSRKGANVVEFKAASGE